MLEKIRQVIVNNKRSRSQTKLRKKWQRKTLKPEILEVRRKERKCSEDVKHRRKQSDPKEIQ